MASTTTALITGGTSGIGRATANKLAERGVHVLVVGRNAQRGEKTISEIRAAGGKADFMSSDLGDAASARDVARQAVELGHGNVDILINNAGMFPFGPTHGTTEEIFDSVYSLNVKAPYFLVAELAPLMAKRGKGAIVNVSTMVADYGVAGMSLYGSSKAALNLLTKAWAAEYGPRSSSAGKLCPRAGAARTQSSQVAGKSSGAKCERGDLNPHGCLAHRILNPARLPIPPLSRAASHSGKSASAQGFCGCPGWDVEGSWERYPSDRTFRVATRWSPVQWGAPGARGPLSRRLGYRAPALGRRPRRLIATRGGHNRERPS